MTTLIYLNPIAREIQTLDTDTLTVTTLLSQLDGFPDGVIIDPHTQHIYWTNMGKVDYKDGSSNDNDGSIERINHDGSDRTTIIPIGATRTPKQLTADWETGKIYWCDREGFSVWRANLDGTEQERLIERHATNDQNAIYEQCVGITLDTQNSYLYWTQKGPSKGGQGKIFRAGLNIPEGATAASRNDIELLWDQLPEPIDLYLDQKNSRLYWTDRGAKPAGNTLNTATVPPAGKKGEKPTILLSDLVEAIGLDLDEKTNTIYVTDLGGNIYSYNLTTHSGGLLKHVDGALTGIAVDIHD